MGGAGPMFGQVGFYRYGGKDFEDKRPLQRYVNDSKRLLGVLDQRLAGREWIMGRDYSIADIAVLPWVRCLHVNYEADESAGAGALSQRAARAGRLAGSPPGAARPEHAASAALRLKPPSLRTWNALSRLQGLW